MEQITVSYQHLIYLIGCALRQRKPDRAVVEALDMQALQKGAVFHKTSAMVAYALFPYLTDRELFSAEEEEYWKAVFGNSRRRATLNAGEVAEVGRLLEQAEIWYVPLKGCVLQRCYPTYGIREMNDVDMLFDETRAADVRTIMEQRGYTTVLYNETNHDIYEKPPIYEFEMHKTLYRDEFAALYRYYADVKSKLVRKSGTSYEYAFTPEDLYIYIITHDCRDMRSHGIGLRQLADIYLYNEKETLDRAYVEAELQKLQILDDERQLVHIARLIYDKDFYPGKTVFAADDAEALNKLLASGNSGTFENLVKSRVNNNLGVFTGTKEQKPGKKRFKKVRYFAKRVFVSPEEFRFRAPFFYKHKWARPAYYTMRVFRVLTVKRGALKKELQIVRETQENS